MIVFIWIITCLFLGFFTTILKTYGISLGGIPTFLIYFAAFSLAGFLSKLWNNRQHRKYVEQLEKEKAEKEPSEEEQPEEEKAVENDTPEPAADASEKTVYKVKVSKSKTEVSKLNAKVSKPTLKTTNDEEKVKRKLSTKAKIIIASVLALLILASAEVITIYVMNKNAQTEIENAYKKGSKESYNKGYDNGYKCGHGEGYLEGYDTGYDNGYSNGYNEGYDIGFDVGYHY